MDLVKMVERKQIKTNLPDFKPGDTLRVKIIIKEKDGKVRYQYFEGVCIGKKHGDSRETFTLRKISQGIGVERTFPLHSPSVEEIEVKKRGIVRRAKLYYIRDRVGKKAKIKEQIYHNPATVKQEAPKA